MHGSLETSQHRFKKGWKVNKHARITREHNERSRCQRSLNIIAAERPAKENDPPSKISVNQSQVKLSQL